MHKIESVSRLTHLLLDTPHGGYPVVTTTEKDDEVFSGLISRYDNAYLLGKGGRGDGLPVVIKSNRCNTMFASQGREGGE